MTGGCTKLWTKRCHFLHKSPRAAGIVRQNARNLGSAVTRRITHHRVLFGNPDDLVQEKNGEKRKKITRRTCYNDRIVRSTLYLSSYDAIRRCTGRSNSAQNLEISYQNASSHVSSSYTFNIKTRSQRPPIEHIKGSKCRSSSLTASTFANYSFPAATPKFKVVDFN